ncbi:MAG: 5'-nucleotidase [Prolixibacteraceae bacterium]
MTRALIILIFLLEIYSCKSNLIIQDIKTENIPNSGNLTTVDSSLIKLVQPYKDKLTAEMQEVIGYSTDDLVKSRPESKLTNYLADLFLEEGRSYAEGLPQKPIPQIAYLNYGGLRTALPQGEITVGKIFELMPFENEMVLLKLRGDDLYALAEKLAAQGGDCVSGLKLRIRDGKIADLKVAGRPFDHAAGYWLVTNDYVANGGDDMSMFRNHLEYIATGIKLRDCIIGYMRREYRAGKKISPRLDRRIETE